MIINQNEKASAACDNMTKYRATLPSAIAPVARSTRHVPLNGRATYLRSTTAAMPLAPPLTPPTRACLPPPHYCRVVAAILRA